MVEKRLISVEVAYALPERQWLLALQVQAGTTVRDAIAISGILRHCPEVALDRVPVGIFGEPVSLDEVLQEGDRVEIYRPLHADPKVVRRELARIGRSMGRRRPGGDPPRD
jgi:putative ubiquitin-RnfH superfamily antitoxin RatB of RatAB toxin-antitoxin module